MVDLRRATEIALGLAMVVLTIAGIGLAGEILSRHGDAAAPDLILGRLFWSFAAVTSAWAGCGLGLIAVLARQNRSLARESQSSRQRADDMLAAKNAADAASEAKSCFLATMSHELRTPLNAVIGFSEIISGESFGPVGQPVYREYAGDILRSGHHMLELVNDILTMAKLDAGRYEVELAPIDLHETVQYTVDIVRGTKHAEGRSITVACDSSWPRIEADERALRQMLLNLLSNAAKFSEPETPIEVRCSRSAAGEMVVSVIDHGIGMTAKEAAQAVRPFYQADSRLARKYEGSGLGLSIVSGLMACHGGRLDIHSEPGVGSRFSLVFPSRSICPDEAATAKTDTADTALR